MKKTGITIKNVNTVSEIHRLLGLPRPKHPLITLINHTVNAPEQSVGGYRLVLNFYNISIKKSFKGKLKYGKSYYDFDEGTMSFMAPHQSMSIDGESERNADGWSLLFHPDLITGYPLAKDIKKYGFFSYAENEALHLSGEEEKIVESIAQTIQDEINGRLDQHSQDIMVKNLDLLLSNCNRFYNRQFLSRKMANNDLLAKFEEQLENYFKDSYPEKLVTVEQIAADLCITPSYLSDMLRQYTGLNTQQHIHQKVIEKAKEILSTTHLSVTEIAYQLGFEYPQSFSKLFKKNTQQTPLEFRQSFD
ncbi:helix-turn-helix domain-containing protein [Anditalea andensis]|uniref:AraC family transcriptional regulator n=1 Tax=Anditalea andensis TaxID=1048983 RepID=A0A074LFZ9_9BACT|nr:response regulator transcription factor [Anditalea andensis]KEO72712.1 AraC family transcriptional regulator [Anditalea andensis]